MAGAGKDLKDRWRRDDQLNQNNKKRDGEENGKKLSCKGQIELLVNMNENSRVLKIT